MKYRRIGLAVVAMFCISLLCSSATQAGQCSQGGAAGKYGFTLTGWLILPTGAVPAAAAGLASVDAKGNVTGTESRSVGGDYADETLQGTLALNSDCTGSLTLQFFESGNLVRTSVLSIVFDDNQREIRMAQKSLQLPNGTFVPVVISVEAKKVSTQED